ncbi:MAG TPA: cytochrome c nitrite reductase small subunit [Longimicrobium sp.]|jgi:cytochrome c nitrite reductase small subunit
MIRKRWIAASAAVLVGTAAGLGAFTFVYAKGYSYLGTDPAACANCHIMDEHYDAWLKSSHRAVAGCNDCHTPHDPVGKYATKAKNGFWHSFYFTVGGYPDPLRITPRNLEIAENACRYCHAQITDAIEHGTDPPAEKERRARGEEAFYCTRCHDDVGHWTR